MSTRCQIGFYRDGESKLSDFDVLIYRHSDGYPNDGGVVGDVLPFLRWWANHRGMNNIEYCAARLLQFLCNRYDGIDFEETKKEQGTLGYGISKDFHGDIEWFYAVRPDKLEIYEVNGRDVEKDFQLVEILPIVVKSHETE